MSFDALLPSGSRPVRLRMRADLVIEQRTYQGAKSYVIKEPLGQRYFRFREEEFAILGWLDGETSLNQIEERFAERFAPQEITTGELWSFLATLFKSGLVTSSAPGQGEQLIERRGQAKRRAWLERFTNILAIRFRGVDPDRFLNWLYPKVRWFFSPLAVIACFLIALAALLLVLVKFQEFQSKLPDFHQFFSLENAVWFFVAIGLSKVLHELGHGLFCKHFGGECHEIGLMFLVLTPCLYCNVSDSWLLESKWKRAAIGAAGMYVEVVLASLCTFVWWFSEPGMLHFLCLAIMFICSVSTLIFNANPLLRFDGYYILSDILEIPNLRQKSSAVLLRKLRWWMMGIPQPEDPLLPKRRQWAFALFSVASMLYRWLVVFSILYFLIKVFEPYRLQVIGQLIAAMSIVGLFVIPLVKAVRFFMVPGRTEQIRSRRVATSLLAIGAIVAFLFFVPLPYRVFAPLKVDAAGAITVFVTTPGELTEIDVQPGQYVPAETQLARLENWDLQLRIDGLVADLNSLESSRENMRRERLADADSDAADNLPEIDARITSLEKQIKERRQQQQALVLVARQGGMIVPPAYRPESKTTLRVLGSWSGTPLEHRNRGAFLETGLPLCEIVPEESWRVLLAIDQSEIDLVRVGDQVSIQLDSAPGRIIQGQIKDIARREIIEADLDMTIPRGGELPAERTPEGGLRPTQPAYYAVVPLELPEGAALGISQRLLRTGMQGQAKIHARKQTIAWRAWRLFSSTFRIGD